MNVLKDLRPFIILLLVTWLLLFSINVNASEETECADLIEMEATAYCDEGIMANGEYVHIGACAMKKDLIGKTAVVYSQEDGIPTGIIGIYEIKDTGGDYRIKNGSVIDIFIPEYDKCIEFGREKVLVQIVDAKG